MSMKVATNWADEGLVGGFLQSSDFRLKVKRRSWDEPFVDKVKW